MFGTYVYNECIKRAVGTFGALFNNLNVIRKDKTGASTSQVKVPISYGPKRKYLERIKEVAANDDAKFDKLALRLPRMSFEIVAINYDPIRQLPRLNYCNVVSSNGLIRKVYTKTPYIVSFQLSIYAKTQDDILQVVEQILPFFTPSYTLTIEPLDGFPSVKDDVPLTLEAVSFSDNYEGTIEERRQIIWSLDFEMKINFYGPISDSTTSSVIRKADVDFFLGDSDSGWNQYESVSVVVNPFDASQDSAYTIDETITFYRDSA